MLFKYKEYSNMGKIFCLETEWKQNVHDLKDKSKALAILEFLERSQNTNYVFRNVATLADFVYYINHLNYSTYNSFSIIYLCFHGKESTISFANNEKIDLIEFAENNQGIFEGRNVHFGSCSTLKISKENINYFKKKTGARMVTGYETSVEIIRSFVFELWLLNEMCEHPNYTGTKIFELAQNRMPYYTKKFKFVAY